MIAAEISLRCRRNGARNFLVALAEVADDHGKLLLALAQKASTVIRLRSPGRGQTR